MLSRCISTLTLLWSDGNKSSGYDEIDCTAIEAEVLTAATEGSNAIRVIVSIIPCTRRTRCGWQSNSPFDGGHLSYSCTSSGAVSCRSIRPLMGAGSTFSPPGSRLPESPSRANTHGPPVSCKLSILIKSGSTDSLIMNLQQVRRFACL